MPTGALSLITSVTLGCSNRARYCLSDEHAQLIFFLEQPIADTFPAKILRYNSPSEEREMELSAERWQEYFSAIISRLAVRPVILASWQRSRAAGIGGEPERVEFRRLADDELRARLKINSALIDIAASHLTWLSTTIVAPHVAYITDAHGIVLHSVGDETLCNDFGLRPGYDWSETAMGTNGAGTALVENAPVAVVGAEHYVKAFGGCTCTAAPIHDVHGRVIGAIDVSTAVSDATPERLIMVAHIALSIERELQARTALQPVIDSAQSTSPIDDLLHRTGVERTARRYWLFTAMACGVASVLARWAIDPFVGGIHPFAMAVGSIAVSAWLAGWRSGLVTALLAHIGAAYFFTEPRFSLTLQGADVGGTFAFYSTAAIVIFLSHRADVAIAEVRRANRRLRAESNRKDQFLSVLSHELRNPLGAISNATQLMNAAPHDVTRALGILNRQVSQIRRLVDDLLDMARISRGRIELKIGEVDVAECVQDAIDATQSLLGDKKQSLVYTPLNAPCAIQGDPARITQVLCNLINNAAKYSPHGARIEVTAHVEGQTVAIAVSDNGIGMTQECLSHLFEKFYTSASNDGGAHGLGVGLWLSHQLVHMHGGNLTAHSDGPGKGAVLRVVLPLSRATSPVMRIEASLREPHI
jgi:signal transduction histidine kinase